MSSFILTSDNKSWPLKSRTTRKARIEAFNILILNDCWAGTICELSSEMRILRWDVRVDGHKYTPYTVHDGILVPDADGWRPITRAFGEDCGMDDHLWLADRELWMPEALKKYIDRETEDWFRAKLGEMYVGWLRPRIGTYYEYNDYGFAYELSKTKVPGAFEVWCVPFTIEEMMV